MSGKSIARNPSRGTRADVKNARQLFKDFRGDHPESLQKVTIPHTRAGLAIGELDGVLYTTVRDGKKEKYIHEFKARSRPLLVASSDGKSLHIIGGKYAFTESGINDR